ncbi:uncharacterized protein SCHCODRAFT_01171595 [Schizophyllum commune H4-8]|nr:uncharacterized protein SCHCODRAFT_01171595 [Schizophyllum commune H4-8]KAI5892481.1 hypothetical protein SCHCODRAFT_01171595 [Schizophyllum commune H4-8]
MVDATDVLGTQKAHKALSRLSYLDDHLTANRDPLRRHAGGVEETADPSKLQGRRQCTHCAYVTLAPSTHVQTYPTRAVSSPTELIFTVGVWRNIALAARHSSGRLNRQRAMESEAGPSSPRASEYDAPPPSPPSKHARSPSAARAPSSHSSTRRANTRSRSHASSGTASTGTTTTQSNTTDAAPPRRRRRRRRQVPSHESSRERGKRPEKTQPAVDARTPGSPPSSTPILEENEDWLWDEQPKLRLDVDLDVDVHLKGQVRGKILMAILCAPLYLVKHITCLLLSVV